MESKELNIKNYLKRLKVFKHMKKICEDSLRECGSEKFEFWKRELEIIDEKVKTYELCFNDLFGGK